MTATKAVTPKQLRECVTEARSRNQLPAAYCNDDCFDAGDFWTELYRRNVREYLYVLGLEPSDVLIAWTESNGERVELTLAPASPKKPEVSP
jgi:hypothetical protein